MEWPPQVPAPPVGAFFARTTSAILVLFVVSGGRIEQRPAAIRPVVAKGKLLGIVSVGDVVKAQHDRLAMENRFMKDYIQGQ